MKRKLFGTLATVLGMIAVTIVCTASWSYIHQDETPKELLKQ
ncbi:cyclic lactone autoinducer peptide [Cohnella sp. AR92]|nr:cyclic lactone autoinducer peptide [Cohnella sp. AR92]RUS44595.1 cyclic lactone autoinducer peptide [Cohnella sp. AR92]